MKESDTTLCATRNMGLTKGQTVEIGEIFEASSVAEARFLINIKKARIATADDIAAWKEIQAKRAKAGAGAGK